MAHGKFRDWPGKVRPVSEPVVGAWGTAEGIAGVVALQTGLFSRYRYNGTLVNQWSNTSSNGKASNK